jgi:hypothetical protein
MADIEQERTHFVKLTNGLDFTLFDRFDGVPYRIAPGHSENLPLMAARHILGWYEGVTNEQMQRHFCKRMGWNTPEYVLPDAKGRTKATEMFAKIKIEPVVYKLVKVDNEIDTSAPIPADPEIPRGPGRPRKFEIGAGA